MRALKLCSRCQSPETLGNLHIDMHRFGFGFDFDSAESFENFCRETQPVVDDMGLMFAGSLVSAFAQVNMVRFASTCCSHRHSCTFVVHSLLHLAFVPVSQLITIAVNFARVGFEARLHDVESAPRRFSIPFLNDLSTAL